MDENKNIVYSDISLKYILFLLASVWCNFVVYDFFGLCSHVINNFIDSVLSFLGMYE